MNDTPQNAAAPAAATTIQRTPAGQPETAAEKQAREARAPQNFEPATGAAPTKKEIARSSLITNPTPMKDEDIGAPASDIPETLPESTIAEMEAGRKALNRHKHSSVVGDRHNGTVTAPSNPVDATERLQQTGKV